MWQPIESPPLVKLYGQLNHRENVMAHHILGQSPSSKYPKFAS